MSAIYHSQARQPLSILAFPFGGRGDFEFIDAGLQVRFLRGCPVFGKHPHHGRVLCQYICRKSFNVLFFGDMNHVAEQKNVPMPRFCQSWCVVKATSARLVCGLRTYCPMATIFFPAFRLLFAGHGGKWPSCHCSRWPPWAWPPYGGRTSGCGKKPCVNVLLRQRINLILDRPFIRGFHRP